MEQKARVTLFVLLFSVGLILGLTFLNILEAKSALLVAGGVAVGLLITLEKIEEPIWQYAVAAAAVAVAVALMAKGSLTLTSTTKSVLLFVVAMLIAPVLAYISMTFIKSSSEKVEG